MTRLRSASSLLSAAFLALLACDPSGSSGDDDDAGVTRLIDEAIAQGNENVEIICDCWDEAGFASRGACLEDQILPAQRRCVEDAYARDAAASELYLDCVVPLMRELGTCLDTRLDCGDASTVDACFADFDLGRESCVQVPLSVQRALDDCTPNDGGEPGPSPNTGAEPEPEPEPGNDSGSGSGSESGGGDGPTDPPPPPAPGEDPPTDPPAPAPGS